MKTKIPIQLRNLLADVVQKQRPDLESLLVKARSDTLSDNERQNLLSIITKEFCTTGLGAGDEPNERGLLLESLLDYLNPVGRKSDQNSGNP